MMKSQPNLISILLPVRNAGPYLIDCLDSISQQTESNWELIAINDHSTDNSFQILQQFDSKDHRIKALQNVGKGIIPALRLALSEASGTLITRMDADDIMPHNKLKTLKDQLLKKGSGHLSTGAVQYFSAQQLGKGYQQYETWLNNNLASGKAYQAIYKECVIPSPCWMVYKSDLIDCGAFDSNRYPEDYDLCFRFYKQQLQPIYSDQILHHWRDHSDRSSRTDPNYSDNRFLELKVHHFLTIDHQPDRPLIIWGAGKKGKKTAALLQAAQIPFHWITNNTKKIGLQIANVLLEPEENLSQYEHPQILICVANPTEQKEISNVLASCGLEIQKHFFFFC